MVTLVKYNSGFRKGFCCLCLAKFLQVEGWCCVNLQCSVEEGFTKELMGVSLGKEPCKEEFGYILEGHR